MILQLFFHLKCLSLLSNASLWHKTMQMLRRLKMFSIEAFNKVLRSNHCTDIFSFFLFFSRYPYNFIRLEYRRASHYKWTYHTHNNFFPQRTNHTYLSVKQFKWASSRKKGEEIMRNDLMRCQKKCKLKRVFFSRANNDCALSLHNLPEHNESLLKLMADNVYHVFIILFFNDLLRINNALFQWVQRIFFRYFYLQFWF